MTSDTGIMVATEREHALWLLEKLVPGRGFNNLALVFAVGGRVDRAAMASALTAVVRRHEALRTVFLAAPAALERQVIPSGLVDVRLGVLPASSRPVEEQLAGFVARPFALDGGPLVRAGLLPGADGDVICLVAHHLVFDTISGEIVLAEIAETYAAARDHAHRDAVADEEHSSFTDAEASAEGLAFWQARLAGFRPPESGLWCGHPADAVPTLTGGQRSAELSATAVRTLAQRLRMPEVAVLLAAYHTLLAAHGAGADQVIGAPTSTRPPEHARAVGYHVNVLPLRLTALPGARFAEFARECRDQFLEALCHTDVPAELLAGRLPRDERGWRSPLVRHLFNYLPGLGLGEFDLAGTTARPLLVENGYSKYDLEFFVSSTEDRISVRAVYGADVLDGADVDRLLRRYDALLCELAADPDRAVDMISVFSADDHAVIDAANDTARPVEPATVVAAIAGRVEANPAAIAVVDGDLTTDYATLWRIAGATARLLLANGIRRGQLVALAAPRGAQLAAAALGVLRAGAAYLPLDPEHPPARIRHQLDDSGARAVLAGDAIALPAPSGVPILRIPTGDEAAAGGDGPVEHPGPDDRAYAVYTSGSTGAPKGSLLTHRGLANVVAHFARELAAAEGVATLWLTTFGFDISSLELFLPLTTGGRLVIAPDEARSSGRALLDTVRAHGVRIVQATPTTWRLVSAELNGELAGVRVLCGGEPLTPDLARALTGAGAVVRNAYAPSETTIYSTCRTIGPDGRVDIGRPISNTRVFVADADGRPLPVAVTGELCIAGAGVALGYHDRPALTARRFGRRAGVGRFYRTGDLGRWGEDGAIELLGRADRQLKVRGVRVEPAEVEAVLCDHEQVRAAAVVLDRSGVTGPVLVAFVAADDTPGLAERLWADASAALPAAAVPSEYVVLPALPVSPNGKTDLTELAELARRRGSRQPAPDHAEPTDPMVRRLVEHWQQTLERSDVTEHTNFFTGGGHSLLGARLVQQIGQDLGTEVSLADLFANPTPAELAALLSARNTVPPVLSGRSE